MPDDRPFLDPVALAHRRHVVAATMAWMAHLEAAGAGKAELKGTLVGAVRAKALLPEEVEGLIRRLGLREA